MMKSAIAENTKCIIKAKGLKQCAVAERAGYSARTFSSMMCGRKIITDVDVIAIATALNVSPNELFGFPANLTEHRESESTGQKM